MGGGGTPPSPPPMSQEERELLKKQAELQDRMNQILEVEAAEAGKQRDIFKRTSGLYDVGQDGQLVLNEDAVKRQREMAQKQMERAERAVAGTLPVSEGTIQRKAEEFRQLKEAAARRGISISGDSLENASSDSTAGAALLGQFKRSYGLIEDAERRGELAGGVNAPIGLLGAASSAGPGRLLGAGSAVGQGYASLAQPYANQRMMEYQGQLNAYNYGQQGKMGTAQMIGTALGGGAGLFFSAGNPYAGMAGAQIGGAAGGGMYGLLGS